MELAIITLPYNVDGKGTSGASGPAALLTAGLPDRLREQGHTVADVKTVELSPEEEKQYGGWNRVGLAGAHLAELTAAARREDQFVLGLLADCNGVLGLLGGLQQSSAGALPQRVGLVYIDAHGDYNTPETSPSGMLGGMPVAIAAGKTLHRLRRQNKLHLPLQSPDIVMMGLRDLDELEREAVEADGIVTLSEEDLLQRSEHIHRAMEALSQREDMIYIHIDLDILNPEAAPAAGLPSPGGLTGAELGAALREMMAYPKVAALAAVSYRADADRDGRTRQEVMDVILGGMQGLNDRK